MNRTINIQRHKIAFGIPLLIIVSMVFLAKSSLFSLNPNSLALGITFDLLITSPIVYFLLIRKTNIPKTTTVAVLIFGLIIGSIILPAENQYFLILFKTWVLPLVELAVLSYVIYNVLKAIKEYKKRKELTFDFFTTLKDTCYDILPNKAVIPFATEIAVFYYAFIYWKKRVPKENEFTYHKNSGTIALLIAIICIVPVEAIVFHLLLMKWSDLAAWIFTFLSIYSAVQIFGFLKSMIKRPISIEDNKLKLRYGILSEVFIRLEEIDTVEITSKDIEFNKEIRKLSPLGELESHNIVIRLNKENTISGLYGIKRRFKTLALYVDNKEEFKNRVENALQHCA